MSEEHKMTKQDKLVLKVTLGAIFLGVFVLGFVGLNYKDHIVIDQKLIRPAEVDTLLADSSKAKKILKWEPKVSFDELVIDMVESDLKNINLT